MSRFYFWVAIFFTSYSNSYELSSTASVRSFPFSGTIDVQYKNEFVLWDQREQSGSAWRFGFAQPRLGFASHGLGEVGVSVFPVGFLELGSSLSMTSRFYESKPFDCSLVVCKGILTRENIWARILLGHQSSYGTLFLALGKTQSKSSLKDNTKFFADEVERILGWPGNDELSAQTTMVGVKREQETWVLIYRTSEYSKSQQKNEFSYFIFRKKVDQLRLTAGIGQYHSSSHAGEFSVIAAVNFTHGQSQSLF